MIEVNCEIPDDIKQQLHDEETELLSFPITDEEQYLLDAAHNMHIKCNKQNEKFGKYVTMNGEIDLKSVFADYGIVTRGALYRWNFEHANKVTKEIVNNATEDFTTSINNSIMAKILQNGGKI